MQLIQLTVTVQVWPRLRL